MEFFHIAQSKADVVIKCAAPHLGEVSIVKMSNVRKSFPVNSDFSLVGLNARILVG